MQAEDLIELSKYRLQTAQECLKESKILLDAGMFKGSAARSYYAIFHSLRAVLALDGFDSKKHSGIISEFRNKYIKTGVFEPEISKYITNLFDAMSKSDYEDFYLISKEDTVNQYQNAEKSLKIIGQYLANIYNPSSGEKSETQMEAK